MSPSGTAASVGLGLLLVAWLASAVSVTRLPRDARTAAPSAESAQLEALRTDVQMQAERLRKRLAAAPPPNPPDRNPFTLTPRERPRPPVAEPARPLEAPAPEPFDPEPPLVLIGVAERQTPEGLVRTAIVAGAGDELHMLTEGQEVAGLYRVRTVSADAVHLERIATGASRRLYLK